MDTTFSSVAIFEKVSTAFDSGLPAGTLEKKEVTFPLAFFCSSPLVTFYMESVHVGEGGEH